MVNSQSIRATEEATLAHELAHGLSSLLSNAQGSLSILENSLRSVSEQDWQDLRDQVAAIDQEAQAQMFQALTVMAHLMPSYAVGLLRPEWKTISPYDLMLDLVSQYERKAQSRGITIACAGTSETALPFPGVRVEVHALRRVFHNVLTNAIKYSFAGSPSQAREVRVWYHRYDASAQFWCIKIQNYGIGIQKDELNKVFRPGYRGRLALEEESFGTGLGLSDAVNCMQGMGGRIRIESAPANESAFLTTLSLVFSVADTIGAQEGK